MYIGIDFGGTKIGAARVGRDLEIAARAQLPTPTSVDVLVEEVISTARAVWSDDVAAVGVGMAGLVDSEAGVLTWVPHVQGPSVPIKSVLESELSVPVAVDNDANMGAIAEFGHGAGRGHDDGLFLTFGTGIGCALVVDGSVYRGAAYAGEVGHMRVDPGGLSCPCGSTGCWESRASGTALGRLARAEAVENPGGLVAQLGGSAPKGEHVVAAALEGDGAAAELIRDVAWWAGVGVANLVAAFDPPVIVVGGGLGASGPAFLDALRSSLADNLYGVGKRPVPLVAASDFGSDAGSIGAAMAAAAHIGDRI